MIVQNLVDLVRGAVRQIDKQNTITYGRTKLAISSACNEVMFNIFKKDASNYDLYSKIYTVSLKRTSEVSASLPVKIVQINFIGDGVRQIVPVSENAVQFTAMSYNDLLLYDSSTLGNVSSIIPYALRGSEIIFSKDTPADLTQVRMQLVRPFEAYDDTEEYYIPMGADMNIIESALQFLGIRQPSNPTNTNTEWQQSSRPQQE